MRTKTVAITILAAGLLAGGFLIAQAQPDSKPASSDARIDKIIEQNEKILKNQEDMLKELADLKEGVLQMRRRTS
jgi:hypothetical protein